MLKHRTSAPAQRGERPVGGPPPGGGGGGGGAGRGGGGGGGGGGWWVGWEKTEGNLFRFSGRRPVAADVFCGAFKAQLRPVWKMLFALVVLGSLRMKRC